MCNQTKKHSFECFYVYFKIKKMDNKIILCEINGKNAFKKGEDGYCYTFNKNEKSRRKAYNDALKSYNNRCQ